MKPGFLKAFPIIYVVGSLFARYVEFLAIRILILATGFLDVFLLLSVQTVHSEISMDYLICITAQRLLLSIFIMFFQERDLRGS
jgi:hypothetical protein